MFWDSGRGDSVAWWAMGLMMLIFWALVVVGVAWWMRGAPQRRDPNSPPSPSRPAAAQILEERFARGEIDAEEFTVRRALLAERDTGAARR